MSWGEDGRESWPLGFRIFIPSSAREVFIRRIKAIIGVKSARHKESLGKTFAYVNQLDFFQF